MRKLAPIVGASALALGTVAFAAPAAAGVKPWKSDFDLTATCASDGQAKLTLHSRTAPSRA